MRLRVKKNKASSLGWHLMREEAGKLTYVPQGTWPEGFTTALTYDQALEVQRSYNNRDTLRKDEARRLRILGDKVSRKRVESVLLPADIVNTFEVAQFHHLKGKNLSTAQSLWRSAQAVIAGIGLEPTDWEINYRGVYASLMSLTTRHGGSASLDWLVRVLRVMNRYGSHYSKRRGQAFIPVPEIPRDLKHRVVEGFRGGTKSDKLTPQQLQSLKDTLSPEHWAWVNLSFWWGLRPEEVDLVCGPETNEQGLLWEYKDKRLTVYQPKLREVARHLRYKTIPTSTPEQGEALLLRPIAKRPTRAAVRRHFPEGVTLYGGRHGFTSYWDSRGVDIRTISRWLGHRHLTTTETYYQDFGLVAYKKVE